MRKLSGRLGGGAADVHLVVYEITSKAAGPMEWE